MFICIKCKRFTINNTYMYSKLWCQNSLYVCSKSPWNHTHVLVAASCGIKWYVFYVLPFFGYAYKKRISWFPQADE